MKRWLSCSVLASIAVGVVRVVGGLAVARTVRGLAVTLGAVWGLAVTVWGLLVGVARSGAVWGRSRVVAGSGSVGRSAAVAVASGLVVRGSLAVSVAIRSVVSGSWVFCGVSKLEGEGVKVILNFRARRPICQAVFEGCEWVCKSTVWLVSQSIFVVVSVAGPWWVVVVVALSGSLLIGRSSGSVLLVRWLLGSSLIAVLRSAIGGVLGFDGSNSGSSNGESLEHEVWGGGGLFEVLVFCNNYKTSFQTLKSLFWKLLF